MLSQRLFLLVIAAYALAAPHARSFAENDSQPSVAENAVQDAPLLTEDDPTPTATVATRDYDTDSGDNSDDADCADCIVGDAVSFAQAAVASATDAAAAAVAVAESDVEGAAESFNL